jgi:hypothetical protein
MLNPEEGLDLAKHRLRYPRTQRLVDLIDRLVPLAIVQDAQNRHGGLIE